MGANGTSAQLVVDAAGGLDFETTPFYRVGLTATSNGSTINCSLAVSVLDVNEPPVLVLGDPAVRNVSEASAVNDYLKVVAGRRAWS